MYKSRLKEELKARYWRWDDTLAVIVYLVIILGAIYVFMIR